VVEEILLTKDFLGSTVHKHTESNEKYSEVPIHAMQVISYERVPEIPDMKPPKKEIQFFGCSL
jgi:hypothetical protein